MSVIEPVLADTKSSLSTCFVSVTTCFIPRRVSPGLRAMQNQTQVPSRVLQPREESQKYPRAPVCFSSPLDSVCYILIGQILPMQSLAKLLSASVRYFIALGLVTWLALRLHLHELLSKQRVPDLFGRQANGAANTNEGEPPATTCCCRYLRLSSPLVQI